MILKLLFTILGIALIAILYKYLIELIKLIKYMNIPNAKNLGWGTKYNNKNLYSGIVKYDDNKEYVGLNYNLIFDGKDYSKIRRKGYSFYNPLGSKKILDIMFIV